MPLPWASVPGLGVNTRVTGDVATPACSVSVHCVDRLLDGEPTDAIEINEIKARVLSSSSDELLQCVVWDMARVRIKRKEADCFIFCMPEKRPI